MIRGAQNQQPDGDERPHELRLEDAGDNKGRGWKRLGPADLVALVYIALKLTPHRVRSAFEGRDAQKSDDACRAMAGEIAARLKGYPVFGPERPAPGPSVGGPMMQRPPKRT